MTVTYTTPFADTPEDNQIVTLADESTPIQSSYSMSKDTSNNHMPKSRKKNKRLFSDVEGDLFDQYLQSCINMNKATSELVECKKKNLNAATELAECNKKNLEAVAELKRRRLDVDLVLAEPQKEKLKAEIRQLNQ